MKLLKAQRKVLLEWISEGLETDEINKRAAKFKPPFKVLRSQVTWYRNTRKVSLEKIKSEDDTSALKAGLALRENRVAKLQLLAERLLGDLLGEGEDDRLWLDQVKGIGSQDNYERIEYIEFNKGEVDSLRGLLDDIAAEVGERSKKQGVNLSLDLSKLTDEQLERIANGEEPLKVIANA
jgi:hypothetical protein